MVPLRNRALNGDEIFSQRDLPNEESFVSAEDENDNNASGADDDDNDDDVENSRHEALSSQVLRELNVNTSETLSDEESLTSETSDNVMSNRNRGPVLSEAESDGNESVEHSSSNGDEPRTVSRKSKRRSRGNLSREVEEDSEDNDGSYDNEEEAENNYDRRSMEF